MHGEFCFNSHMTSLMRPRTARIGAKLLFRCRTSDVKRRFLSSFLIEIRALFHSLEFETCATGYPVHAVACKSRP